MNQKSRLCIFILIVFQNLILAQTNNPDWVVSRKHSAYPESRFILGIGSAQGGNNSSLSKKNADNNALAEISLQILTNVKSVSKNQTIEIIETDKADSKEETQINVDVTSETKLMGAKIVEQFYDENENIYYSLAVFDKFVSLGYLKNKLTSQRKLFYEDFENAKSYISEGSFWAFIQNLKEMIKASSEFNNAVFVYNVLASQNSYRDSLDTSELQEQFAYNYLNDVLSKIEIIKVAGDSQKVFQSKPVEFPLTIKLIYRTARDVPLKGVSVSFNFINGKGEFSQIQQSDNDGIVAAKIIKIGESNYKKYLVEAKLDFSELTDTIKTFSDLYGILKNYKKAELFSLEKLELFNNTKALVLIDFTREQNNINPESLFSSISKKLIEHGITAVKMSDLPGNINSKSDKYSKEKIKSLFEALKLNQSEFSFIIECNLTADFINELYGYKSYSVSGNMRAFSLSKSKSIAEETIKDIKGAAATPDLAAQAALKKIPDSLINKFVESIINGVYN